MISGQARGPSPRPASRLPADQLAGSAAFGAMPVLSKIR